MIAKSSEKKTGKESKREIVIPGETIISGQDYLPGEWTKREGKDIVALRFGLADK
jgi:exosome complex RNA-binding protein Csl4